MDEHAAKGVVVRALVADRAVRLLLAEARPLAERTRWIHGLGPDAARLGGEAIVAGMLSAAQIKGDEQLTVQIQGERPRCSVYVDITATGALRARITPPDLRIPGGGAATDAGWKGFGGAAGATTPHGEAVPSLGAAAAEPSPARWKGMILVIKHSPGGEMYRGVSSLDGGSLEQALGAHFGTSTQVDAVLRLGCTLGEDEQVVRAGGLLLERLPTSGDLPSLEPDEFRERFGWVRDADIGQLLTQAAFGSLGDERIEVLERSEVRWQCRCSRAKIEETLASLGAAQLEILIREDHGAEVSCHFCGAVYRLDEDELRAVLATVRTGHGRSDTRG